jgi:hypothetical protein
MKRPVQHFAALALASLVTMVGAGVARAQDGGWKEHRSDDCRCSAQFPGTPQAKTQKMQSSIGNLDSKILMLEVPGSAFYALAYVDYPKNLVATTKSDELLDGARDGAVSKVKGTLKTESKITQAGFPGRELRIEAPGDIVLVARIYMVKERLYQQLVVAPRPRAESADTKKFLDSFKFDKP